MNPRLFLICLLSVVFQAMPAAAHEFWLAPSRYHADPGAAVEIHALAGTGFRGEEKPWDPEHTIRFLARTARSVDLRRAASPGDFAWARFAPSDAGGAMLAFESGFTSIELPAEPFDKYLGDEGLDGPLAARRASGVAIPGRERYRRCAKVWLAGGDPVRATSAVGLPLEVVPLSIPGADATLRARVLWTGRPLAGALVKAWRAAPGPGGTVTDPGSRDSIGVAWNGRTDSRGEVSVPAAQAGEWLLSAVHMAPCSDRDAADWESTWASLTFQRAEGSRSRSAAR